MDLMVSNAKKNLDKSRIIYNEIKTLDPETIYLST